ncbi:PREDICTED: high affinity cationic amino acid transporter 1-like [Nicrophorus vespilloides]|uniref:High affinity cationic amino acid transporter 1-like n=1 Tax=Nicrophorus vespilloides TaxID=110193 RepID=A0ABM1MRZ8_NICVS|nr:PREDICTED: high affinity cationic amino acid transporter 1-like [Nicrophorus vespilloides]
MSSTLWKVLTRRKFLDQARVEQSSLARVLNTFDLTALGVGSTLGVGMYVLVGKVAKETAGPAVILSFLIAAIASAFAGVCYAEFGARTPRAGSAYIYSYVCVGEFVAFVIGWNLILEYIIGSASVARGMSLYIDSLVNNTIKDAFTEIAPINVSFLSPYFDFLAFSIALILSIGLAFGMKESSKANNCFTVLNVLVVLFVIIAGSFKADPKNWSLPPNNSTDPEDAGGFFPFGVSGMIKGAATCFYGFVGFDCIATTGEEVKNPQKAIPFAIITSLAIVFIAYFATSTVITLMVPYYLQDVNSPIPCAFAEFGWDAAKWIVTIGGIFALLASLFGAMFPLPRIIYAMASDGLIFKFLGKVSERFSTPVTGTLLAGLLTGTMAALFEQGQLVDMMSIGTLLAYTIVAACVLLLRYSVDEANYTLVRADSDSSVTSYTEDISDPNLPVTFASIAKQMFNCTGRRDQPTKVSEKLVSILVVFFCVLCVLLGLCFMYLLEEISHGVAYAIVLPAVIGCLMIITLMMIGSQPTSKRTLTFKVPLVPVIPAISILVNVYLMLSLDSSTWIRFGVWMGIGLPLYLYSALSYEKANPNTKPPKAYYFNFAYVHEGSNCDLKTHNNNIINNNNNNNNNNDGDEEVKKSKKKSNGLEGGGLANGGGNTINQVMANLDKILEDQEEASGWRDEASQKSVVALVHREDEVEIPAVELSVSSRMEEVNLDHSGVAEVVDELRRIVQMEEEKMISEAANDTVIEVIEDPFDSDVDQQLEVVEFKNVGIGSESNTHDITVNYTDNERTTPPPPPPMADFEKFILSSGDNSMVEVVVGGAAASPPPPPPPITGMAKFMIPRVNSNARKKLKPVIPSPDYKSTLRKKPFDDVEDVDGIIEFGSKQHDKIKEKLMDIIKNKVTGLPPPQKLTRSDSSATQPPLIPKKPIMDKLISEIPRVSNAGEPKTMAVNESKDDDGDNDNDVSREDFKKKLNNLFGTVNRTERSKVTASSSDSLRNKTFPSHRRDSADHQENHRQLMKGAFSSIISRAAEKPEDDDDDDRPITTTTNPPN